MKNAKIEVFKPGRYGDSEQRIWNEQEVKDLVNNYKPDFRNAPIILGHNTWEEKPAYGWCQSLELNEKGVVVANIEYTDELEKFVSQKMYQAVSIEATKKIELFDYEGHSGPYLLAIAFLGGSQPAVSGLQKISFTAEESQSIESFSLDNIEKDEIPTNIESEVLAFTQKQNEFKEMLEKFNVEKQTFQAEMAQKEKELNEKVEQFLAKEKATSIKNFFDSNNKKFTPASRAKMEAFALKLEGEQLEAYKETVGDMPELEIFKELAGGVNPDTINNTDKIVDKAIEDFKTFKR